MLINLPKPDNYKLPEPLKFDYACAKCNLSTGCSVSGAGPTDLKDVKLIIVSDFPSFNEVKEGYPLVFKRERIVKNLPVMPNAGTFLRRELTKMFRIDTYNSCYITNALKCDKKNNTVGTSDFKTCVLTWLKYELDVLDTYVPKVPILSLGQLAFEAFKLLNPSQFHDKSKLKNYRFKRGLFYLDHPIIYSVNPAAVCKSIPRVESLPVNSQVNSVDYLEPIVGSPLWQYRKEMQLLQDYLI